MTNRPIKNSAINQALNRLEDAHQIKREENAYAKKAANPATMLGSALPLLQLESIFKSSQKTFRGIAGKFQRNLNGNPWPTLAKVAIGCLVVGMVIGRIGRSNAKGR